MIIYHNFPSLITVFVTNLPRTPDKARDEASHAAQNAKSEKDMKERDAQRMREYEEVQKKNAGGPSSQGNNAQGGSGSSGTTT